MSTWSWTQTSYLSQISQIIFVEKNLSCGEISDFCKEFEQFVEFYRNLCFRSKFAWKKSVWRKNDSLSVYHLKRRRLPWKLVENKCTKSQIQINGSQKSKATENQTNGRVWRKNDKYEVWIPGIYQDLLHNLKTQIQNKRNIFSELPTGLVCRQLFPNRRIQVNIFFQLKCSKILGLSGFAHSPIMIVNIKAIPRM